jgi:hypothetical protein
MSQLSILDSAVAIASEIAVRTDPGNCSTGRPR